MNYDKAHDLARAIKESEEYRAVTDLQAKVDRDKQASRMLDDFRKRQLELQMRQMSGEEISQEEAEQMQRLYETLNLHADIRLLLETERRLFLAMEDIQRIIAEPFEAIYRSK